MTKVDDFWQWSRETLSTGLRAGPWYNNRHLPFVLAGFLNDYTSRMIGFATIRQLRVRTGK
jgi:hypothetical protein